MYLALNNQQWLICNKKNPNHLQWIGIEDFSHKIAGNICMNIIKKDVDLVYFFTGQIRKECKIQMFIEVYLLLLT